MCHPKTLQCLRKTPSSLSAQVREERTQLEPYIEPREELRAVTNEDTPVPQSLPSVTSQ